MSAIGSVIVMVSQAAFSPRFPDALLLRTCRRTGSGRTNRKLSPGALCLTTACLPTALRDARQLAGMRHLAKAHAAESELAIDSVRSPASLAPGIAAHLELRLARRLVDQCLLGHGQDSLVAAVIMMLAVAGAVMM